MPRPSSSTSSWADEPSSRTATRTSPPLGLWLAQPGGIALHHDRGRIDDDPDSLGSGRLGQGRGRVGGDIAQVDRATLERYRTGVRTGKQQQVVDEGGQVVDLRADVVECLADRMDGLVAMALEMLERAPNDRQRGAQLVARVSGELALATERQPLRDERFANGDQRPPRVDGAEADGHEDDDGAADDQDPEDGVERFLLGSAVLEHLQVDDPDPRISALGQDADRHGADLGQANVDPGYLGPVDPGEDRNAGRKLERAAIESIAGIVGDERIRPRRDAAERDAEVWPVRVRPRTVRLGSILKLLFASGLEGRRGAEVEGDRKDDQDEQRRPAAERDEPPADTSDQPRVGGQRIDLGGVASTAGGRAVRHRRGGTPRRGPSRSGGRRRRASSGGNGHRRRPRSE